MNYEKPAIIPSNDLAEGVYAASGSNCYSVAAKINQRPELGRDDYRIQIDAHHQGDHTNSSQNLIISFNQPVTYISSPGILISGDGTETLTIKLNYWQNSNDNIGFGNLVVKSINNGLTITNVAMYD